MNVFGAVPTPGGVRFGVWAPRAGHLALLTNRHGSPVERTLDRQENGIWTGVFPDLRVGDLYAFSIDGSQPRPDPASRCQPDGVHGWSEITDPAAFNWTDDGWPGLDPSRVVLYELHVG
ncbi:MAG TPA: hypothetical protein VN085_01245, partial [Vicinamibacterales bacterium]|nr:hypothetical protein [Vicinamibacterales bacterium]